MENLMKDLETEGDLMDPNAAEQFLKLLFEELKVPITAQDIKKIIKYCLNSDNKISKTNLQSLIIRSLPTS